ncbi:MAG: hypothetical protein LDLANPLL_01153 [Turneriella sp.]|nr:hypothetical protein [Turneriella sp.]
MRVRNKLIIALLCVISVSIIPISIYSVSRFEASSISKAQQEGKAQALFFARSIFNLLLTNGGNLVSTQVDSREILKIFEGQKAQGLHFMKAVFLSRDESRNGFILASWPSIIEKEVFSKIPPEYTIQACALNINNRCMVFSTSVGLKGEAPNLLVSLEYSEAAILAPIQELKQNLAVAISVAFVIVFILAIFFSFQMTRPLKILKQGTRELAKGNLDFAVTLNRRDEFGELASSFNSMLSSLKQHIEELKEKDRELNAAQTIQRAFLPESLPQNTSFGFAAHFTPMAQVGGDLYDVFEVKDGYGIFIADVSGHGVPAALITGMAKMAVAVRHDLANSPAQMAAYLNATLYGHIGNRFLTLIYAFFSPAQKKLTFANGGHPDLWTINRETGEINTYNCQGGMVGVFADQKYAERTIELNPKDRVVFLTDGVLEHENDRGEMYGKESLRLLLQKTTLLDAQNVCVKLFDDMLKFRTIQPVLNDDATILVLDAH